MFYVMTPEKRLLHDTFCFYEGAFSDEECDRIIEIGTSMDRNKGRVSEEGTEDLEMRNSSIGFIPWSEDLNWLFDKLSAIANDANSVRFQYTLTGYLEGLQFTEYFGQEDGHYDWHQDSGPGNFSIRKLSQVVLLSHPDEYEGGELSFFSAKNSAPPKTRGTVICFPSFENHKVEKVTKGLRRSLVAWVSGPPFR